MRPNFAEILRKYSGALYYPTLAPLRRIALLLPYLRLRLDHDAAEREVAVDVQHATDGAVGRAEAVEPVLHPQDLEAGPEEREERGELVPFF